MTVWNLSFSPVHRMELLSVLAGLVFVAVISAGCDQTTSGPEIANAGDHKSGVATLSLKEGNRVRFSEPKHPESRNNAKLSLGTSEIDAVESGGVDLDVSGSHTTYQVNATVTSSSGLEKATKPSGSPLYPTSVTLNSYNVSYSFDGLTSQSYIPADVQPYIQEAMQPYGGTQIDDPIFEEPIANQKNGASKANIISRFEEQGFRVKNEQNVLEVSSTRADNGVVTTLTVDPATGEIQSSVMRAADGQVLFRHTPQR